jgi:hypothetical protein
MWGFSVEIGATGFANPVPPGFPEGKPLTDWYKLQSCALSHDNQSIFSEQDFFASFIGLDCLLL